MLCFDTDVARKYGVDRAVMLCVLVEAFQSDLFPRHTDEHGGIWVSVTGPSLSEALPFWDINKIWRLTRELESLGVIESRKDAQEGVWHRNKWYKITYAI